MRLNKLHIHGVGPLTDATLDLTQIEPGLVAICGDNGAGKSTLMEGFPAALGLGQPTRAGLQALAMGRDSFVEAQVVNGQPWTIRHLLDRVSGKGEVLVTDADGKPALDTTGRKAFGAWAKKNMPSPEVFFSSVFAAQGQGGFAALSTSDRKACILRLLGVEKLETWAEACREQLRDAKAAAETARARLRDVASRLDQAEGTVQLELADSEAALADAAGRLVAAEDELRQAERAVDERRRAEEQEAAIAKAAARAAALLAAKTETETKIANNEKLLADRDRVERARAEADRVSWALPPARWELDHASQRLDASRDKLHLARVQLAGANRAREEAEYRLGLLAHVTKDGPMTRQAAAEQRTIDLAGLEVVVTEARRQLEQVQGQQLLGAEGRIAGLRQGLATIACDGFEREADDHVRQLANAALDADDAAALAAEEHPLRVSGARATVVEAQRKLADARTRHDGLARVAARLPEVEAAEREAQAITAELGGLRSAEAEAADAYETAGAAEAIATRAHQDALSVVKDLDVIVASLVPALRLEAPLAAATARIAELRELLASQSVDLSQALGELATMPEPVWPTARPVPEASARLQVVKAEHAVAVRRVATVHAARDAISPLRGEHDARQGEVMAAEDEVSDWSLLADALGRNGLQAILADAAGPELSEVANDLLHTAFGPRFTVRFDTTRASADGKQLIEDYDISVLDTQNGREGSIDTFSGGEKVILAEAVALALTTLSCRRHGLTDVTIVRDESGAALDADKALQYMAMLRRARTLASCRHLLFVSHDRATWELADARVVVAEGKVTVQ